MKKKLLILTAFILAFTWQGYGQAFTEDFSSDPSWTVIDNDGQGDTWYYSSSGYMMIDYESNAHDDYLITPQFTITSGTSDRLNLDASNYSSSYVEEFDILLSTTGTSPANFTTTIASGLAPPTSWTAYTYDLSAYAGQTVYIAFKATSTNEWNLYIDNVVVDSPPSCTAPSGIAYNTGVTPNLTATTADFMWTAGSSETDWEIVVQVDGTGTPATTAGTGTAVSGTPIFSATGLSANTPYEVYYRANCGGGDFSAWVGPVDFTTPASCLTPSAMATSNLTSTSVDLTWTASASTETAWEVAIQTDGTGTPVGTGTAVTTTAVYSSSALTPNTDYEIYYRANCGGGDFSTWVGPVDFTTPCVEITSFPFTEDFESSSATRDCWTITDGNSDGDAWNYYNSSSYANSGSYSASIYTDYNSANNDWLISPTLTLSGSKRLKFWTRARSSSEPEEIEVMLSTAGISVSSFTTTLMASTAISNTTYVEYTIDLSSHSGDVNIAFVRRNSPADGYYLYLDDVTVEDIPSCLPPSALATSNLAATSVDLTWTASASAETDWEVVVQADGTGTPVGTGTAVTTTAAHSATGLTAETAYEIYYRANCGGGDFSTWVGPVDFTTPASCLTPTTLTTSNVLSTSADLSWVDAAASGLSNVEYGVTGFSQGTGTMITGTTNTTESISGLTAETTYDFYVQADCGASVSAWAGPTSFYTGYTSPSPSSVDGVGITNVTMGSINNTTVAETNNYGDYSNIITYVAQDAVFPIYITLQTGYTYNLFAWVDWNDDLDFDDADEAFYLGQSTSSNPTTLESSITVPSGVSLGNHRIRIGGADSGLGSTIPSNPNYTGGYASFEDYTLEVVTLASVLPVELIGLSGQTYERNNELTWTTASETNNDYFTIEKSIDGIHYDKIGEVEGNGNSSSIKAYSFNDFEINSILVYYKLTQVDFDGTKEEVGTLKMTRELNNAFSYPNPANDELNFTFNATYDGDIIIEYIDIQGKSISENVTINANRSFKSTVFQTLSSGLYFTRISENGTVIQSMKIVKL